MSSSRIRPAAMAGLFYPADALILKQQVESYLAAATPLTWSPKAIVTPHAGYAYSGAAAGKAWGALAANKAAHNTIQRIVLLGPTHRVPIKGIATSAADYWQSPLGNIALDKKSAEALQRFDFVAVNDLAHAGEHSLEVQIPFIQIAFPQATLLPLVVGEASPEQVRQVLDEFWYDPATRVAISSDLSHFHDYQTAQRLDTETTQAIEQCHYEVIGPEQACGCRPLSGLLQLLRDQDGGMVTLALLNSGDTAGQHDQVVGYGAYAAR